MSHAPHWRSALTALGCLVVLAACDGGPAGAPSGLDPVECPTAPPSVAPVLPSSSPADAPDPSAATGAPAPSARRAVIGTSLGEITIELYPEVAPLATANFVALARCGFYEGITFHRVLAGFVAQAGDPATRENTGAFIGLGSGGPGYGFSVETPPPEMSFAPYTVAMANNGMRDGNGSQFFISLGDLSSLPHMRAYTIFGRVVDGTEVVDAIGAVEVNDPQIGIPVDPVVINWIVIQGAESTAP